MKEIWKDIEGYEGLYQISNMGRVKSLPKLICDKHYTKEKILKGTINNYGYLVVDFQGKKMLIHRLVAEAFIPNKDNKPCVDHIDTNRTNNNIENLKWVTHKENNNNILTLKHFSESRKGKKQKEESKRKRSKSLKEAHKRIGSNWKTHIWTDEDKKRRSEITKGKINIKSVICIETQELFKSIKEANEKYNTSKVGDVCNGKRKTAGKLKDGTKLHWMFYKDWLNTDIDLVDKLICDIEESY